MAYLSISDAARLAGVDRRTIQRQIKRGVLSAVNTLNGQHGVDAAELARVYPDLQPPQAAPQGGGQSAEVVALEREVQSLRQQLDEVRQDRDHWRRTAQQLLPGPRRGLLDRLGEALAKFRR